MSFVAGLRRLWRHRLFRRLLVVRVAIQGADGLLQVALASFVLFSPQRQPDAASIAAVLAVTLLPFSVLGPFVSVTIDRFSRRQILLVGALGEAVLALGLAAVVGAGVPFGLSEDPFEPSLFHPDPDGRALRRRFLSAAIGVADVARPDFGDPVEVRPGEVPVFWACGVTPQAAVMQARPPFAITHKPGHMFLTDLRDHQMEG